MFAASIMNSISLCNFEYWADKESISLILSIIKILLGSIVLSSIKIDRGSSIMYEVFCFVINKKLIINFKSDVVSDTSPSSNFAVFLGKVSRKLTSQSMINRVKIYDR